MPTYVYQHFGSVIMAVLAVALLCALVWYRYKRSISKAKFALVVVSTCAACFLAFLNSLTGSPLSQLINTVLPLVRSIPGLESLPESIPETSPTTSIISLLAMFAVLFVIYRFSVTAILTWDGPPTVLVNELAKLGKDNELLSLAKAEVVRLIQKQTDPIVSDAAVNWKQHIADAPSSPRWENFACELFLAAFTEAAIPENGWRDRAKLWVGEIFSNQTAATPNKMLLFVFEAEPSEGELQSRLSESLDSSGGVSNSILFAVYDSFNTCAGRKLNIGGREIELWSRRSLLNNSLRLSNYARDLIRRFDVDVLGGTSAIPSFFTRPRTFD